MLVQLNIYEYNLDFTHIHKHINTSLDVENIQNKYIGYLCFDKDITNPLEYKVLRAVHITLLATFTEH